MNGETDHINEQMFISLSDQLAEAKYKLTIEEQKLLLAICFWLTESKERSGLVRLHMSEIVCLCEFEADNGRTLVRNTSLKLLGRILQIKNRDTGEWSATHWIQTVRHIPHDDVMEYTVDDDLAPELPTLYKKYSPSDVFPLIKFDGKYAVRLYLLIKKTCGSFKGCGSKELGYAIYELADKFELSGSYFDRISNLKNFVFEPSIKEINERSDIHIEHEYIMDKHEYIMNKYVTTRIHFKVTSKNMPMMPEGRPSTDP